MKTNAYFFLIYVFYCILNFLLFDISFTFLMFMIFSLYAFYMMLRFNNIDKKLSCEIAFLNGELISGRFYRSLLNKSKKIKKLKLK